VLTKGSTKDCDSISSADIVKNRIYLKKTHSRNYYWNDISSLDAFRGFWGLIKVFNLIVISMTEIKVTHILKVGLIIRSFRS
jgi:ssDNA-specific exonuclease RecJ